MSVNDEEIQRMRADEGDGEKHQMKKNGGKRE